MAHRHSHAGRAAELGTGGIMMPVMIYKSKVPSAPKGREESKKPAYET